VIDCFYMIRIEDEINRNAGKYKPLLRFLSMIKEWDHEVPGTAKAAAEYVRVGGTDVRCYLAQDGPRGASPASRSTS
jgi:hypothetical protein